MVTVFRGQGLSVVIFLDDHEPAHVHVFGDGQAKINLGGADRGPMIVWIDRMTRSEARRAMMIVKAKQEYLLERWRDIHG